MSLERPRYFENVLKILCEAVTHLPSGILGLRTNKPPCSPSRDQMSHLLTCYVKVSLLGTLYSLLVRGGRWLAEVVCPVLLWVLSLRSFCFF